MQNNAPAGFPAFIRDKFDLTVVGDEDYKVSEKGLIYKDFRIGSGAAPQDGQQVTFDYTAVRARPRRSLASPALNSLGLLSPHRTALASSLSDSLLPAALRPILELGLFAASYVAVEI